MKRDIRDIFSKRLRERCNEMGISQAGLSKRMKITTNSISGWFKGRIIPRPDHINEICEILDVTPAYMFGGIEEEVSLKDALLVIKKKTGISIKIPKKIEDVLSMVNL